MRKKSDINGGSTSSHNSSFSMDDESLIVYFEEKQFFSAFYEFSQGSGPVKIWEYGNSNDAFMRFIVNTPPPDSAIPSLTNYSQRVTNVISKFEEQYYIALYSQVLDCQARGFARSVVLVVANPSPDIIKFVHEAYINKLTDIIDQIYQNSYNLFINEVQGYSLSLLKTADATNSPQLKSKLTELKLYLPSFGIDIDKIIKDEEKLQQKHNNDSTASDDKIEKENLVESNLTQKKFQLDIHGEIKDELFFTKIDNNLRLIEDITDFNYSIVYDLQDLIANLPMTETSAAIAAHIDIDLFRSLPPFNLSNSNFKKNSNLSSSSEDLENFKNSSSYFGDERIIAESLNNEKLLTNLSFATSNTKIDYNENTSPDKEATKKVMFATSLTPESYANTKKLRKNSSKEKGRDSTKRRSESSWIFRHKKPPLVPKPPSNRRYDLDYIYDFNYGGFKGRYSQLVTNILNTNYDMSVFTLQWLVKFKVFHYCAFTILSGGTLVILTTKQDTVHGKSLADRFSLLAPFSLIKEQKRKHRKKVTPEIETQNSLEIKVINDENEEEDNEDIFNDHYTESQIILVKDSVEPRECFKYSIVVTNHIKQSSVNSSDNSLDSKLSNLNEKQNKRKFPIVTTFSNKNENDQELLSVLDLATNVYRGDCCPDSSFVMNELGKEASLHLSDGGISGYQSTSQLDQMQLPQQPSNLTLKSSHSVSSSSSTFSPISNSKRKMKSSFNKQTVTSPPSPLSLTSSESPTRPSPQFVFDQISPTSKNSMQHQKSKNLKNAPLRSSSSSIITMCNPSSSTRQGSSNVNNDGYDPHLSPQNSMLINELENESEFSISETDSEFSTYTSLRRGIDIGTYSGTKHGRKSFRSSFLSDASSISNSNSMMLEGSESENLFILNMYSTINAVTARFVSKLAELSKSDNLPTREEILNETGFSAEDEPILKYWIYCYFNKQKCRPVLFNNRTTTGLTVILYK
ncbi:hypothetical protein M9Y10_023350 [Tritrichomonas musculus]|uniref:Uncharacterized protein n=1 Tax=Tritrichomonas musculus TaxID=1915356 RepID=A0ABR2KUV9_9EUKA